MWISRLHIALLAIMSIFTGIIAPGTSVLENQLAYPMTDARIFSYILLFFLIIGFYTASIHTWRFFRYNSILIFGTIGILFFLTLTGQITETKTGLETNGLSWGWIFIGIGTILLFRAYKWDGKNENPSELRQTIDTLLGIVGSFTLACIASVIVLISLSFTNKSYQASILERAFWSGNLRYMSGNIITTQSYEEIPMLQYDRRSESLIFGTKSKSGSMITLWNPEKIQTLSWSYPLVMHIRENLYTRDAQGHIYSWWVLMENARIIGENDTIISQSWSNWNVYSSKPSWSFDYSGTILDPVISGDRLTLAWNEKTLSGTQITKMWKPQWEKYEKVYSMNLSQWWYDIMSLVESTKQEKYIVKNNEIITRLDSSYISGSYISNGSHSIYQTTSEWSKRVVVDGQVLPGKYDEIREVFLEKNGGYYAYFAKPVGWIKFCLFTKYRGNLCGLDGYMNPRLSPDGSSIIYAGYQDGIWNIYRNTEVIVKNTHYVNSDISGDYVFFDITNPRTYLFIKKDISTGKYSLIKNGKNLPWFWDDFGTEVSFGYDNHIILKLKDKDGWKIAEL